MNVEDLQLKIETTIDNIHGHHYGVLGGMSGLILYFSNLYKIKEDKKYTNKIEELFENIFNDIFHDNKTSYSYSFGLSGIGYVIEYVNKNKITTFDVDDCLNEVDDALINILQNCYENLNLDFLHGHLGIVLYFLKKEKINDKIHNVIQNFIDKLSRFAEWHNKSQIKWKFWNTQNNKFEYNISLSHGMSAIVMALLKIKKNKIENNSLDSLIEYSTNYILSQQIDIRKYGSYFSYLAIESEENIRKSRLAWCYGDLGIAVMLWNAGVIMNNQSWINKSQEILLFAALERRDLFSNSVFDAGLCHGTSGIALIFYRMYKRNY